MRNYPSTEQLVDLFDRASPGMAVTDSGGRVVLANKAAGELLGTQSTKGTVLPEVLGMTDYPALLSAGRPVENRAVSYPDPEFPSGFVNIGFGGVDGKVHGFWALRPSTDMPAPSPGPAGGDGSGSAWIARVDRPDGAYVSAGPGAVHLIKAYYDHCPVAIHLIEEDGTVAHANWKDIEIVGASQAPDSYVGHHIRRIYADKEVVEDFLGRWGEDAPIIDFRADFLNGGERVPVVIFSTANVVDGSLRNTRCFVFPDDAPHRHRDRVGALDLSF